MAADGHANLPFSVEKIVSGPYDYPKPEFKDISLLHKSLIRLLNYLIVDWCQSEGSPVDFKINLGVGHEDVYDMGVAIINPEVVVTKDKINKVLDCCQELFPFLEVSVMNPSLILSGSLTSFICYYNKMWVTPNGILSKESPRLSRNPQDYTSLRICCNFHHFDTISDVASRLKYYFLRLKIASPSDITVDLKFNDGNSVAFIPHSRARNSYDQGNGSGVNVHVCGYCPTCQLQTSVPIDVDMYGTMFKMKICVRKCSSPRHRKCEDLRFGGRFTILGPYSIPVLDHTNRELLTRFQSHFSNCPTFINHCSTHLILIFEHQDANRDNINDLISTIKENCLDVFTKNQHILKMAVTKYLNGEPEKTYLISNTHGTTVNLTDSSRRLAQGIADIVENSTNVEFKNTVKKLLPYQNVSRLQCLILEKSRGFGVREIHRSGDIVSQFEFKGVEQESSNDRNIKFATWHDPSNEPGPSNTPQSPQKFKRRKLNINTRSENIQIGSFVFNSIE